MSVQQTTNCLRKKEALQPCRMLALALHDGQSHAGHLDFKGACVQKIGRRHTCLLWARQRQQLEGRMEQERVQHWPSGAQRLRHWPCDLILPPWQQH